AVRAVAGGLGIVAPTAATEGHCGSVCAGRSGEKAPASYGRMGLLTPDEAGSTVGRTHGTGLRRDDDRRLPRRAGRGTRALRRVPGGTGRRPRADRAVLGNAGHE